MSDLRTIRLRSRLRRRVAVIAAAVVAGALVGPLPTVPAFAAAPTPSDRPAIDAPTAAPPNAPPAAAGAQIIVDNRDPGFTSSVGGGAWATSSGMAGFHGTDYAYAYAGSGGTARWTPDVQAAGWYGVYYWIPAGTGQNRATAAKFTVHSAAGTAGAYSVNESVAAPGVWKFLGNHRFEAGTAGYVELVAGTSGTVVADAIRLGPTSAETITAQLDRAKALGATEVTLAPGKYSQAGTLNLDYPGMDIDAEGVWLEITNSTAKAMYLPADGLTLTGLTANYNPIAYTQGRITEKAGDEGSMLVTLFAGYRKPSMLTGRVITWDSDLRLQKRFVDGATFAWHDQPNGVVRISKPTDPGFVQNAVVGDIVTIGDAGSATEGISVDGTNVTLRDVALRGAPGMGLMNAKGGGNLHLDGFQLIPPVKPAGATEDPIMSSIHDGLQFQAIKVGPTIENSLFVNAGDDTWSNPGIGRVIIEAASGSNVTVKFQDASWRRAYVGDRLQQWVGGPEAVITGLWRVGNTNSFTATLDRPSPWAAGTEVTSPDRVGAGFVFRNNQVDSSGRGLLVRGPFGEITGNWIRGANAISIASVHAANSHADAGGNLLISGNEFHAALGTGGGLWDSCQRGAVSFEANKSDTWRQTQRLFPDIELVDNTFVDIPGINLSIALADGLTVSGNQFVGTQRVWTNATSRCNIPTRSVINVMQSDDVTFSGNTIDWIGPYSVEQVGLAAATTTGITGLPGGVAVGHPYAAIDSAATYRLANAFSERLLARSGSGALVQQAASGAPAQDWMVTQINTSTWYRIVEPATGNVLTANDTTSAVGFAAYSGQWQQMWQVLDARDGLVKLVNRQTGKVLATNGDTVTDGAAVGQYPMSGVLGQTWELSE